MKKDLSKLQKEVARFRDDRNWRQFHSPKNLAMSIVLESAELLECFQWKNTAEVEKYLNSEKINDVKEEMADVLLYLLNLTDILNIDLIGEAYKKLEKNNNKYPVEKAKNNAKKYDELEKE